MLERKNHFTIGILDDVTFTSLPEVEKITLGGLAYSRLSSTIWVLIVPLVQTKTS